MRYVAILYWLLIISCGLIAGVLCLPSSVWLQFINATIAPTPEQADKISSLFFNGSKIQLYRLIALLPILLAVGLVWKRNLFQKSIYTYFNSFGKYLKHLFVVQFEIIRKKKVFLFFIFLLPVLSLFKYTELFPFTVDEAFSWLHLVRKGPLVSAFYYPAPNNHIFYSVVCSFVNYFSSDPVWVMRIPTVAAYLFSIYLLYLMLTRLLDKDAGIMATMLFALHPSIIYYGLHGRGYMFLVLFVLLSAWFLYSAMINKVKPAYAGFIVSAVLGFYTIPVFLYYFILLAFSALFYVLWNKRWQEIRLLLFSFCIVIFITLLLYAPVIILNGIDALVNNSWVQPQEYSLKVALDYLSEVAMNVTVFKGVYLSIAIILAAGFLVTFYYEKKTFRALTLAVLLWIPVLATILWIQKVLPFERIWVPFVLLWIVMLVWLDAWFEEVGKVRWLGKILFVGIMILFSNDAKKNFAGGDPYYEQLHAFVKLVDPAKVSSVYSADDTYLVMLQVKFAQADKEANFTAVPDLHGQNADLRIIPLSSVDKEVISADEERFFANSYIVAYRHKGLKILR